MDFGVRIPPPGLEAESKYWSDTLWRNAQHFQRLAHHEPLVAGAQNALSQPTPSGCKETWKKREVGK